MTEFSNGNSKYREMIMKSFSLQVITGRWFMAFASFLIMSVAGATFMFGLYSSDIKSSLGYGQTTLNLLSFFKDLGGNIGIISGLINEITPPWVILFLGALMNFSGYFMIWLAVTGKIAKPKVWHMCVYMCVGSNSQSFANTGVLVTCVKNFPQSRGVVIGLLKGFLGLSGAIITQLYHALYGDDSKSLILLIGWLPAVVSFVFLRTIRIIKVVRVTNELKVFYKFLYASLILAGCLMVIIIMQNNLSFNRVEYGVTAGVVVVLVFAPLFIVIKEELALSESKKQVSSDNNYINDNPKLEVLIRQNPPPSIEVTPVVEPVEPSCFSNIFRPPERGEDYSILQALFSIDMILLFGVTLFGVGGTLTAIDNLGQIGRALDYPKARITTFVSLVSIWGYLGRIFAGFVSEILLTKYKFPRPLMLTFVLLFSCIGHLLIAFGVPNSLYFTSVIMGFCFGAQWPLIFVIISELFGLKHYATLYNMGSGASPVGNYLLNVVVAGGLYDREAMKQMEAKGVKRLAGEDLTCTGVECYKLAFLIITVATVVGSLISFILVLRTRDYYRGDIYKKFREEATKTADDAATNSVERNVTVAAVEPRR